ncbi:MAG: hypothetical protein ACO2XZ_02885 [Rickettsiales bacterium]
MSKKIKIILFSIIVILTIISAIYMVDKWVKKEILVKVSQTLKELDEKAEIEFSEFTTSGLLNPKSITFGKAKVITTHHKLTSEKITLELNADKIPTQISLNNTVVNLKAKEKEGADTYITINFSGETILNYEKSAAKDKVQLNLPEIIEVVTLTQKNIIKLNKRSNFMVEYDNNSMIKAVNYSDNGLLMYKDELAEANLFSKSDPSHVIISRVDHEKSYIYNIDITSNSSFVLSANSDISKLSFIEKSLLGFVFLGKFEVNKAEENMLKTLLIDDFKLNLYGFTVEISGKIVQDWKNILPFGQLDILLYNYQDIINAAYNSTDDAVAAESYAIAASDVTDNFDFINNFTSNFKQKDILEFIAMLNVSESENLLLKLERIAGGPFIVNNFTIKKLVELFKEQVKQNSVAAEDSESDSSEDLD